MSQLLFVPLDKIQEHKTLNVMAVVQKCWKLSKHKRCTRRVVSLIDQTSTCIDLILWDSDADNFCEDSTNRIIYGEGLEYTNYRGSHQLKMTSSSILSFDPILRAADRLRAWHKLQIQKSPVKFKRHNSGTFPPIEFIGSIINGTQNPFPGLKKDVYITVKGQISASFICSRLPRVYEGCTDCGKKVTSNNGSAPYKCSSCNKEFDSFTLKYRIKASLFDYTGQLEVTLFDEVMEKLMGKPAEEFAKFKNDESICRSSLRKICWRSYLWKLKVSTGNRNNCSEMNVIAVDVQEVEYKNYTKDLEKKFAGLKALS